MSRVMYLNVCVDVPCTGVIVGVHLKSLFILVVFLRVDIDNCLYTA